MLTPLQRLNVLALLTVLVFSASISGAAVESGPAVDGELNMSAADNGSDARFERLSIASATVFSVNGSEAVWKSSETSIRATALSENPNSSFYKICLRDLSATDSGPIGCDVTEVTERGSTVTFDLDMRNTSTGRHVYQAQATHTFKNDSRNFGPANISVQVVSKSGDLDGDQLSNIEEFERGLNMTVADTDGDGLTDGAEVNIHGTDPAVADTDGDGIADNVEVNGAFNATKKDTDGDGLLDGTEQEEGTDPTSAHTDADNLTDARELEIGTDPTQADTDSDGLDDGRELALGTDPLKRDSDGDGVEDGREVSLGIDPNDPDTDGDFLRDGMELLVGTNPDSALSTVMISLFGSGLVLGLGVVLFRSDHPSLSTTGEEDTEASDEPEQPTEEEPTATATESEPDESDDEPETPLELMTPADRVEHLLQTNDGHIPQADIVEQTDWSKAKVSRTLSKMEEEGEIRRYRLGRGNIVTEPDVDPADAAQSEDE